MSIRKTAKRLIYRYCPGVAGSLPYFGTRVFFPRKAFIFDLCCDEGIYEAQLLTQITGVIKPGSWYFDVGANVGLMSVPILKLLTDVHVLSCEPSANSRQHLAKTWSRSTWRDRWRLVFKAVGDRVGETEFWLSRPNLGGYDGIKHTQRVDAVRREVIPITTLDREWSVLGRPEVSCIKLDIEGAELQALRGATELIRACRPHIFLEWYAENFRCFGCEPQDLLAMAEELRYEVVALPSLSVIQSAPVLLLHMRRTAAFVMVPCGAGAAASQRVEAGS
jgi:FkbM family methyltransferase